MLFSAFQHFRLLSKTLVIFVLPGNEARLLKAYSGCPKGVGNRLLNTARVTSHIIIFMVIFHCSNAFTLVLACSVLRNDATLVL